MGDNKTRNCLTIEIRKAILKEQEKQKRSVRQLATDMSLKYGMTISRSQIQRLLADKEGRKRILESDENTINLAFGRINYSGDKEPF